jgi:cyclic pyranopterin phosphate synthase
MFYEPAISLRSISDWLLKGPAMRIPCDAYNMLWIGAVGTVQPYDVAFKLGSAYQMNQLCQILNNSYYINTARDAFALNCPNSYCRHHPLIMKHAPSVHHYKRVLS